MDEEQRYLFDLQGYLHLPNVISAEAVASMNASSAHLGARISGTARSAGRAADPARARRR
jgi:hypothetical protein